MRAGVIPPLISHYVRSFKASSLILVTHILGASANWLLLRFLAAAASPGSEENSGPSNNDSPTGVILLSFLRDYDFWRDGARRLGVDITKLASENRFICIDGLSELFAANATNAQAGAKPARLKPAVIGDHVVLRDSKLQSVEKAVLDLVARMNNAGALAGAAATEATSPEKARTVLIVDGLDFLMAAIGEDDIAVQDMLMSWRLNVHSLIVTASADAPLLHTVQTPLEVNHRNLVVTLAHQTKFTMSLRLLDTGTAKDVSGVLSISRGPYAEDDDDENELLYFVSGDGQVKVFERGAAIS